VEFDVMLAGCGTPVLIHDETLSRTTDGAGEVAKTPYHALAKLSAGKSHPDEYPNEPIPTLSQAIRLARSLGLKMNLEIKPAAGYAVETAQVVARSVLEEGVPQDALVVSSFSREALAEAARLAPGLNFALLAERIPADWRTWREEVGAVAMHCDADTLNADAVSECLKAGLPVVCYTVNDAQKMASLVAMGVGSVFTDSLLPGVIAGR
ncbi:MAG: hypothetical protein RIR70_73, partial [Pseudomonadota bacterium]|jgi:glycerophosphoryl diester phosphodiesterase